MQYRDCGKLNFMGSALGFGCMRLPVIGTDQRHVHESQAIANIRYAIDNGVNYVDTAYFYHGGQSEVVLGKALLDGYRDKVRLSTKAALFYIKEEADFDRYLAEQLERLQTNYIDFYVFHGLNRKSWENVVLGCNLLRRAEEAKARGLIRHIGFSFHDNFTLFREVIDSYSKWEFCLIQYNYLDKEKQAGRKGLQYAADHGMPVMVMEPLQGGKLANPPLQVKRLFEDFEPRRTPAEWALLWLWNQPEISMVLSGMTTMEQVKENLSTAEKSGIGILSGREVEFLEKTVCTAMQDLTLIPCTQCSYCMPCPKGVNIPGNFGMYNDGYMYGNQAGARALYGRFGKASSECVGCRICEEKCPQKIPISEWMAEVHAVLGEGNSYNNGG